MHTCFVAFFPTVTEGHGFSFSMVYPLQLSMRDEFLLHAELFLTSDHQNCVQQGACSVAVLLRMWSGECSSVSLPFLKVECHPTEYLQKLDLE